MGSARELARALFEQRPEDGARRRIVELCGMDSDVVLAERDARSVPPCLHATLEKALVLAREDAERPGQTEVRPENLLVGLLRGGGPPLYFLKEVGGLDVERFCAELGERFEATDNGIGGRELAMHADAQAALESAVALARERRAEWAYGLHLLHALTRAGHGPISEALARYGVSAANVNAELAKGL